MKKIIFIISITLLAFNSQAQGTLQFNQVLTFVTDTSFTFSGNGVNQTHAWDFYNVPSNKTVKITKAINQISTDGSSGCPTNYFYFSINGVKTTVPLLEDAWLKENDILGVIVELGTSGGSSNYHCYQYDDMFISLIEYNIIPE
jgi:hypothetical protein